jgi:hypothetical protein
MNRLFSILLTLFSVLHISAQRNYLPTPDDLKHFATTTTYVVLSSNPLSDYNFEIRDAVEKTWTLTPYEFLEFDDFAEKSLDPQASFLYVARVNYEKDKTGARYQFLCLSLGDPDRHSLDDLKDITNLPLSYVGVDEDQYAYKLATLLRFVQMHTSRLLDDPALVSQNVFQMYNKNMGDLSNKTLYVIQDEIDPKLVTDADIRAVYPYSFKIVEREELREIILSGEEGAVFLHKVGPEGHKEKARVYKALIGVDDAEFYYYNHHKTTEKNPDALLMNDFRRIQRTTKSR